MGGQLSSEVVREKPYPKTDATLYYFAGRGLADQIRWLLAYSGVTFAGRVVDKRARFLKLAEAQLPFGQLPLLQIDGIELVQSQAIIRYLAKRASLLGTNAREEAVCDMIAETIRDLIALIAGAPFARRRSAADGEEHIKLMKEKWLARASRLEQGLKANGGQWFVGKSITYADILMAHCLTWYVEEVRAAGTLTSHLLDIIIDNNSRKFPFLFLAANMQCGPGIVENMPRLVSLQNRIIEHPSLRGFIQGRQWYGLGQKEYCDHVDEVLGRTPE